MTDPTTTSTFSPLVPVTEDGALPAAVADQQKHTEFRHVAAEWIANGTEDVDAFRERVASFSEGCLDIYVMPGVLRLDGAGRLRVADIEDVGVDTLTREERQVVEHFARHGYTFNSSGLRTLASWAGIPSRAVEMLDEAAGVGDRVAAAIFASLINWGLDNTVRDRIEPFFLRTRKGEVRAVFSAGYTPVNNDWCVDLLASEIPGGRFSHIRYDGDTLTGMMLVPDAIRSVPGDSDYGSGVFFSNSEVGVRQFQTLPAVFRAICMNGCIWGRVDGTAVETRHRGVNLDVLAERVRESIRVQLHLAGEAIDDMLATRKIELGRSRIAVLNLIDETAEAANLNREERRGWYDGWLEEGGELTAFAVVQGLTRSVRFDEDPASASREALAGRLVSSTPEWWSRALARAAIGASAESLVPIYGSDVSRLDD